VDVFKKCVAVAGDPQFCLFVAQVGGLVRSFANCIEALDVEVCYRMCLERCRGERCREACLGVLGTAIGVAAARRMARRATVAAALLGPKDMK
jgi:hypothetical protein